MKHTLSSLGLSFLALAACGADPTCPPGSTRLGDACLAAAADDARGTVPDADADPADPDGACGDGLADPGEACDDGNLSTGDGCSGTCEREATCAGAGCVPEPPVIRGAASMAPGRELWTWSEPEGSTRIELSLDGEPVDPSEPHQLSVRLAPGDHELKARACSERGCSAWASHRTTAEAFGQALPAGLTDTAREFARTSLGHPVALGCEACASDGEGAPLAPAAALAALKRALAAQSDVLAIGVALVGGELRVTAEDASAPAGLARLADVLADAVLRDGDALVLLDLVESEPRLPDLAAPAALAEALRDVLLGAPSFARNGRPLLVRTTLSNGAYLSALREALADAPELAPYVRYVLRDPEGPVADFYALDALSSDAPLVPALPFVDAVTFSYGAPELPNRITLSRRAGRAVIVEGVPASDSEHGHALITALRDLADLFLTRYPAERARARVSLADHALYFDGHGLSQGDPALQVWHDASGLEAATSASQALAGIAEPLVERHPASGLLPPAVAFSAAPSAAVTAPADALGTSAGNGFAAALFGVPGEKWLAGDGRALVMAVAEGQVNVITPAGSTAPPVMFTDADAQASCGAPLRALLAHDAAHWLVVYYDVAWTLLVDGACAITKPATFVLPAQRSPNALLGVASFGGVVTAASIARFPSVPVRAAP